MKPIHKFNNSRGATLCHKCSVVISIGLTEDLYCDRCKQKQHLVDIMKSDVELGLYEETTKCYCGHTTYCDCGPEEPKKELEEHYLATPTPLVDISRMKLDNHPDLHKQETLEDLLNRKANQSSTVDLDAYANGLDAGAKWQQEQDKNKYSELIDLLERLTTIYKEDCDLDIKYNKKRLEFIEKYKENENK